MKAVLTFAAFLLAAFALADSPADVRFVDGSMVRMLLLDDAVEVVTKYGTLSVPLADVRRIDVGLHPPAEAAKTVAEAVASLGSDVHKKRETAARTLLSQGRWAVAPLRAAEKSTDREVAARAAQILQRLAEELPADLFALREHDVITTPEFVVVGRLAAPALRAKSSHFGETDIRLADLRTLHIGAATTKEMSLDAGKYAEPDQWCDTGLTLDSSLRLSVSASGSIDLWSQSPGQYMTTPKGFSCAGKLGSFMAGSLVARVGNGQPFLLGEAYSGTPLGEGRLWLHIVPHPWGGAPSAGIYRVRLRVDNAAMAQR